MLTLVVNMETLGRRVFQAATVESLVRRLDYEVERNQAFLDNAEGDYGAKYRNEIVVLKKAITDDRPQGFLPGYGYALGSGGEIYLDSGTGEVWESWQSI